MTVLLHRLNDLMTALPDQPLQKDWAFSEFIEGQSTDFFKPLVKKHLMLNVEYSIMSAKLASDLKQLDVYPPVILEQLACTLMMAELMEYLYRHYLVVPREVARLHKDKLFYRQLLKQRGYQFQHDNKKSDFIEADVITQRIRQVTAQSNWQRLLVGRCKRLLMALIPVMSDLEIYRQIMSVMDKWTGPVLAQLSWIFFTPRFIVNFLLVFKHLLPGWWMNSRELQLGFVIRLLATMQRHWFELGNDSVWAISGLLNCFVLVGSLGPVGAYLTVILFGYDILLAGIRAYIELSGLYYLKKQYKEWALTLFRQGASEDDIAVVMAYLHHLEMRLSFEKKRLGLTLVNTTLLFLAMVLTLPIWGSSPIIPLIAAISLVAITITVFYLSAHIEKQRPFDKVAQLDDPLKQSAILAKIGFFNDNQLTSEEPLEEEPKVFIA